MIKRGATDLIQKPFPSTGRTPDKAIKEVLAGKHAPPQAVTPAKPKKAQPFKGGELVFYPDRVELCGTKIIGDTGIGHMRKILEALKETKASGKFVAYSGAGQLLAWSEYIGYEGTGTFTQSGGTHTVSDRLILGCLPGSNGTYNLSGDGHLSVVAGSDGQPPGFGLEFIGWDGQGTFTHTGGSNSAVSLFLGGNAGCSGTYNISSGASASKSYT